MTEQDHQRLSQARAKRERKLKQCMQANATQATSNLASPTWTDHHGRQIPRAGEPMTFPEPCTPDEAKMQATLDSLTARELITPAQADALRQTILTP